MEQEPDPIPEEEPDTDPIPEEGTDPDPGEELDEDALAFGAGTVMCQTEGCEGFGIILETPPTDVVICGGSCGNELPITPRDPAIE